MGDNGLPSRFLRGVQNVFLDVKLRKGLASAVLAGVIGGLSAHFFFPDSNAGLGVLCGVLIGGSVAVLWPNTSASSGGTVVAPTDGGGTSDEAKRAHNGKLKLRDFVITTLFFLMNAAISTFLIALWAGPMPSTTQSWRNFGGHLLVSLSAASVGALLGFLLGVPRSRAATVATSAVRDSGASEAAGETTDGRATIDRGTAGTLARPGINSNLEDVSDWLTKTLIGAGLTQLTSLPGFLQAIGTSFKTDPSGVVFGSIIVFGLGCGFLGGYIFTRIFVAGAFQNADEGGGTK